MENIFAVMGVPILKYDLQGGMMKFFFTILYAIFYDEALRSYLFSKRNNDIGFIRTALCRAKAHPCGVIWYTMGFEPDMHCKNCNDDLS